LLGDFRADSGLLQQFLPFQLQTSDISEIWLSLEAARNEQMCISTEGPDITCFAKQYEMTKGTQRPEFELVSRSSDAILSGMPFSDSGHTVQMQLWLRTPSMRTWVLMCFPHLIAQPNQELMA
jgi:hypothetical protein